MLFTPTSASADPPELRGEALALQLRDNVVRIVARFAEDADAREGFGFVVGERDGMIYIVTANHVVRPEGPNNQIAGTPAIIFFQDMGTEHLGELLQTRLARDNGDVAVIRVREPLNYHWLHNARANTTPKRSDDVWFVGLQGDWYVPARPGAVNSVFNGVIRADSLNIRPGTSGAPLISQAGIIGMVITDSSAFAEAIPIDTLEQAFQHWNYPWQLTTTTSSSFFSNAPLNPPILNAKPTLGGTQDGSVKRLGKTSDNIDQEKPIAAPPPSPARATNSTPTKLAKGVTDTEARSPAAAVGDQSNHLVGYVLFSKLDPAGNKTVKTWFDVEGKPNRKFPVPNDILVANRDKVALRELPYHWDINLRKHVVPAPIAYINKGEKIKIGSGAIIANDENNGSRYVIMPVSKVFGDASLKLVNVYSQEQLQQSIIGYVYIGLLDANTGNFSMKTFDKYSGASMGTFPAPDDLLVARGNVWLHSGPRHWDQSKQDYVDASKIKPIIKKGQHIRVGGDTVLAKGGLSLWVPISQVINGSADPAH